MWTTKTKILYVIYKLCASWLPESRHAKIAKKTRYFFAKCIVSELGTNVNVERKASFTPDLKIGNNSGIGISSEINGPVKIGNDVMMGPEVIIYTSGHRYEKLDAPMREQGNTETRPVIIEDDVWIGRRVIIMPGVVIGKGTVIGAGAVVTKSIPEYSVVGGVPAKILKSRISPGGGKNLGIIINLVYKYINCGKAYFRMEVAV